MAARIDAGRWVATRTEELAQINWVVHDCTFELEDLTIRTEEALLPILSEIGRARPTPGQLRIRHVRRWTIEDNAGVGSYDINEVRYDAERREVLIEANIPLLLRFAVSSLDVEVTIPGVEPLG